MGRIEERLINELEGEKVVFEQRTEKFKDDMTDFLEKQKDEIYQSLQEQENPPKVNKITQFFLNLSEMIS